MSLSPISPLIADWIKNGLLWKYVNEPKYRAFTVPKKGQVQLPREGFIYQSTEGLLLSFGAAFDHPLCGIRMKTEQIDTENWWIINNMTMMGAVNQPWFVEANIPPQTTNGVYQLLMYKKWAWNDAREIFVINDDTEDHTCYSFNYTMAVLLKKRPPTVSDTILRLMFAREIYEIDKKILEKIPLSEVERWILDAKAAFKTEVE